METLPNKKQLHSKNKLEFRQFLLGDKKNSIIFKKKIDEIRSKIVKYEVVIDSLFEERAKAEQKDIFWHEASIKNYEEGIAEFKKEIKKFTYYYNMSRGKIKKEVGKITDEDIVRAKEVPIDLFMPCNASKQSQNRKYYKCPLHNEKTPSFVYYTDQNSYSCFGCSIAGDNIDLYMKLNNCDFITAIKELIKL